MTIAPATPPSRVALIIPYCGVRAGIKQQTCAGEIVCTHAGIIIPTARTLAIEAPGPSLRPPVVRSTIRESDAGGGS